MQSQVHLSAEKTEQTLVDIVPLVKKKKTENPGRVGLLGAAGMMV